MDWSVWEYLDPWLIGLTLAGLVMWAGERIFKLWRG
jgi:hypothetical protein